jgi:hypothetical protein
MYSWRSASCPLTLDSLLSHRASKIRARRQEPATDAHLCGLNRTVDKTSSLFLRNDANWFI